MRAYLRTYASFFALVATLALVAAVSISLRPQDFRSGARASSFQPVHK